MILPPLRNGGHLGSAAPAFTSMDHTFISMCSNDGGPTPVTRTIRIVDSSGLASRSFVLHAITSPRPFS